MDVERETCIALAHEAIVALSKKIEIGTGKKEIIVGDDSLCEGQGDGLRCLVFIEL